MQGLKPRRAYVTDLVAFGREKLGLEFDGSFTRFSRRYRTANWLYAVSADGFVSALPSRETFAFSWNRDTLRRRERRLRAKGHHTYLYRAEAHGGRACPITPSLLEATQARQAYVVLHEAWHATLRLEGIRMPYALEEATGRVVGVMGAVHFAQARGEKDLLDEVRAQALAWGAMARFVNRVYGRLDRLYRRGVPVREQRRALKEVQRAGDALRRRTRSAWEREELTREINNAFLFRYHDYTRYYPLALRVYRETASLSAAMMLYKQAGREGARRFLLNRLAGQRAEGRRPCDVHASQR